MHTQITFNVHHSRAPIIIQNLKKNVIIVFEIPDTIISVKSSEDNITDTRCVAGILSR